MKGKWSLEIWCVGPEGAVKTFTTYPADKEPNADEVAKLRGETSGFYRRRYAEWHKSGGFRVTPPDELGLPPRTG